MKPKTRNILLALGGALLLGVTGSESNWFASLWKEAPQASLTISGNIEAHESVLSFKQVQSRIVELPFDEGQWVHQGDLIARLDDADYRQNVEVARATAEQSQQQYSLALANLEAAKKAVQSDQADLNEKTVDYRRAQALYEAKVISTQVRDLAETAFRQSEAGWMRDKALTVAAERNVEATLAAVRSAAENLKLSEIILGYTVLRAPFDGVMLTRQAEVGEVMLPGTPVATLADIDHVWVRAYINETDIGRVRFGQSVTVTTDTYPGKRYAGRISAIASKAEFTPKSVETHAERVTLVYRIKIDVYNPTHELVPGMPADAEIALGPSKSTALVPSGSHE
jgi:HlyD family secretion protein